jgi:hypothetical protein
MRKGFEVNGDYRLMDSSELVYILTNSAQYEQSLNLFNVQLKFTRKDLSVYSKRIYIIYNFYLINLTTCELSLISIKERALNL